MGRHLELTPRLRQIAGWVPQGAHRSLMLARTTRTCRCG